MTKLEECGKAARLAYLKDRGHDPNDCDDWYDRPQRSKDKWMVIAAAVLEKGRPSKCPEAVKAATRSGGCKQCCDDCLAEATNALRVAEDHVLGKETK